MEGLKNRVTNFADKKQLDYRFVVSNMSEFFRRLPLTKIINRRSKRMLYWYPHIQHGVALLGLCAPLSYIDRVKTIYVASSYSVNFPIPHGSHPTIENNTRWGETICKYDGYEFDRQKKISIIKKYMDKVDPKMQIRVCFISPNGGNCSNCSKCRDTMAALVLEGIDPNKHGFSFTPDTLTSIKQYLEQRFEKPSAGFGSYYRWLTIQRRAASVINKIKPEYKSFFEWLIKTDLKQMIESND